MSTPTGPNITANTVVSYVKHMVECNCILQKFKHYNPPVWHKFVVFSEINALGEVIPSFVQCNNCDLVHKVTEIATSVILKKDNLSVLPSIEECKQNLPPKLIEQIDKYDLPLPTWQELESIFKNKFWGMPVILSKDDTGEEYVGKLLLVIGESLWKIDKFSVEKE